MWNTEGEIAITAVSVILIIVQLLLLSPLKLKVADHFCHPMNCSGTQWDLPAQVLTQLADIAFTWHSFHAILFVVHQQ